MNIFRLSAVIITGRTYLDRYTIIDVYKRQYVKYEGVDRISIVPVQDGKIAIKAPQIQNMKSRAVINTKNSNEYGLLSINGTLMFEDMYLSLIHS